MPVDNMILQEDYTGSINYKRVLDRNYVRFYIAMEIYVFGCINIFSLFYYLCLTNMTHHYPTMNYT
jgi:hypothetical protein